MSVKALSKIGSTRDSYARTISAGNDRIERAAPKDQTHWDVVLVWFMRAVALLWIAKGIASWAQILNVLPGDPPFENEPLGRQAAAIYFAVMDFTAAVGLWLTSAWGGVVWLIAVTSSITFALIAPELLGLRVSLLIVEVGIVIAYFILSWLAARETK